MNFSSTIMYCHYFRYLICGAAPTMLSVGLTSWLASRNDMPVPRPLKTWAMVVAVTRSSGGNQALEMARGALPTCTVQYSTVCTVQYSARYPPRCWTSR